MRLGFWKPKEQRLDGGLRLTVELSAGMRINHAAEDMAQLARALGITVVANFNGLEGPRRLQARPGDGWEDVLRNAIELPPSWEQTP